MTMMAKRESSIWSRVRSDVDVDDLIFDSDRPQNQEDTPCSER